MYKYSSAMTGTILSLVSSYNYLTLITIAKWAVAFYIVKKQTNCTTYQNK